MDASGLCTSEICLESGNYGSQAGAPPISPRRAPIPLGALRKRQMLVILHRSSHDTFFSTHLLLLNGFTGRQPINDGEGMVSRSYHINVPPPYRTILHSVFTLFSYETAKGKVER